MIPTYVKKSYVKHYNIPITIFDDQYFYYYLNIMNKYYNTNKSFKNLILYLDHLEKSNMTEIEICTINGRIVDDIMYNSDLFNADKNIELDNIIKSDDVRISLDYLSKQRYNDSYLENINVNTNLTSIDLVEANINMIKLYTDILPLEVYNFDSLIKLYAPDYYHPYIINSKKIRQYLFGELGLTKKLKTLQKYTIANIINMLKRNIVITNDDICAVNDDEIILYGNHTNIVMPRYQCHIKSFILNKPFHNNDFYVKTYSDGSIDIKNTPAIFVPQIIAKIENRDVCEYDLLCYYEGQICKFIKPLV